MMASYVNIGALNRIAIATASEVLESSSISFPLSSFMNDLKMPDLTI